MTKKKDEYTCWHAHDYSTIEKNGKEFVEIAAGEFDKEDKTEERVELIVKALNKAQL